MRCRECKHAIIEMNPNQPHSEVGCGLGKWELCDIDELDIHFDCSDFEMDIKSLKIKYRGEPIISDVDDCLIKTTQLLKRKRISKRYMFYGTNFEIFKDVVLTEWGKELIKLIIADYPVTLWTAGKNRFYILKDFFHTGNIQEGMSNEDKVNGLKDVDEKIIYVDDKKLKGINNSNVIYIKRKFT